VCSSFTGLSFCGHVLSLSVFPGRYLEIRHSVNAFHDPPTSTVQRLHRTAQPHTDPVCHCQPAVSSFLPSLATKARPAASDGDVCTRTRIQFRVRCIRVRARQSNRALHTKPAIEKTRFGQPDAAHSLSILAPTRYSVLGHHRKSMRASFVLVPSTTGRRRWRTLQYRMHDIILPPWPSPRKSSRTSATRYANLNPNEKN